MLPVADVINSRRRIPQKKDIALHIAVVGEQIAFRVEVEGVGIAKAVRNDLGLQPIRREPNQTPTVDGSGSRRMLRMREGVPGRRPALQVSRLCSSQLRVLQDRGGGRIQILHHPGAF